jgi:hypothetical protein
LEEGQEEEEIRIRGCESIDQFSSAIQTVQSSNVILPIYRHCIDVLHLLLVYSLFFSISCLEDLLVEGLFALFTFALSPPSLSAFLLLYNTETPL